MTSSLPNGHGRSGKAKRARSAEEHTEQNPQPILIDVERCGDWLPAHELREAALSAVRTSHDVTVNLGNVDHLDASALQILLALDAEQQRQGRHLKLANASPHLRQWFEYAGATEHLSMTDSKNDD